jgi:hypothetical protein
MAKFEAFTIPGIHLTIPSGDHEPPHLHARKPGEWSAKVYIQASRSNMIELIRPPGATIKGRDRRAIIDAVETHRAELLAEWEECQAG